MFSVISLVALLSILPAAFAQSPVWGQYYSQCLPGAAPPTTTTPPASPSSSPTTPTSTQGGATPTSGATCPGPKTKFQYFGVNESGAEFGSTTWPGELGKDYTWPAPSSIDYFVENGFNVFRVTFLMERMNPPATGLLGPFNETYLSGLTTTVSYITEKGAFAIIDPHNYMRYDNAIINSTTEFQSWWQSLATVFATNPNVIFDVQNEPYGIDAGTVFDLNQAAINGIRASGATSQLILVEGTSYTGAWTWISSGNGAVFGAIQDPSNNVAVEMHQYLDSDGSGTSATCVNNTIGVDRLQSATQWLQENNLKGFLGEIGAGSNTDCAEAVAGALCLMQQSDVWIGASWWAAGPWWGTTYYQSIEPPADLP
ncbi:hypothetical protein Clacol_007211 [Clathrus columnatus]|uniref:cellulase n=1 Tax=Clathrus columnatus TaxID=1419009 RepID=A0AAV5AIK3_9AGAM|nr:hypothetical protein Clacol_007211 [Clathrus columnatus]